MMPVRAAAERLRYGLSRYQALDATSPVAASTPAAMRKRTIGYRSTRTSAALSATMTREPGTDAAATETNAPSQPLTSQPKQAQYASTFVPGVNRETAVSTACPPSSSQPSAAPLRRNNSIDASPPPSVRFVSRKTTQVS